MAQWRGVPAARLPGGQRPAVSSPPLQHAGSTTADITSPTIARAVILCSSMQRVTKNMRQHGHFHGGNGQTPTRDDKCTNKPSVRIDGDADVGHTPHGQMVHVALRSLVLFFGSPRFRIEWKENCMGIQRNSTRIDRFRFMLMF
ncbi:hypothetical protein PVAP13_8NG175200 [Panicum virgatum]|uniref:Uncharacterized protein n=1 Tax=Panicum virgatum TaxID=38727 RepID=A0A8T0P6Y8_PANVG|nr:hypothetical protein PVAP13_8NG175200 [Panicum virgatum]